MKRKRAAGFTLIELMVVVVVIAILGVVAYPSYQDHLRKAKRAEGRTALLKAAQQLERWYSDKATYGNIPVPPYPPMPTSIDPAPFFGLAANATVHSGENPADTASAYTITVAAPNPATCPIEACFLITATPKSPFTDTVCGNLTLTSNGTRCWSTSGTPATTCAPNPANASTCKW